MLSPALKADIQKLWDAFWSGGISNPLTAIEQITYLVFLKRLEDLDNNAVREGRRPQSIFAKTYIFNVATNVIREQMEADRAKSRAATEKAAAKAETRAASQEPAADDDQAADEQETKLEIEYDGDQFKWSIIRMRLGEDLFNHVRGPVFSWLKAMEEGDEKERMRDAVFLIPNANLLTRAISIIDGLFVSERNQDTLGDIYEHLLKEIAVAGKNGQFRTPRHIIRAMCDLVDPQVGERICDPACGTGGFLVNAYQHILKRRTSPDILRFAADGTPINAVGDRLLPEQHLALRQNHFHGLDFDRTMVRLGWMNLVQHGLENPQIYYADSLGSAFNTRVQDGGDLRESFDVVLANPPFTGNIDASDIGPTLKVLDSNKTELLFVELILQLLKPGGRAAVIVPEGVLFGSTRAHLALRKKLVEENELRAVVSLPVGVFQPYTGVKTSILVLHKGGRTDTVWFYDVGKDGEVLKAKRTPQPEQNDLWDLSIQYSLRYGLRAPAFVNGDEWEAWRALDDKTRSKSYAQPLFESRSEEDEEGGRVAIDELVGFEHHQLAESRTWEVNLSTIRETDQNLSAGRHKPLVLGDLHHDSPVDIITELLEMESEIQERLGKLRLIVASEGQV